MTITNLTCVHDSTLSGKQVTCTIVGVPGSGAEEAATAAAATKNAANDEAAAATKKAANDAAAKKAANDEAAKSAESSSLKGYVIRDGKKIKLSNSNSVLPNNDYYTDETEVNNALKKLSKGGRLTQRKRRQSKKRQLRKN